MSGYLMGIKLWWYVTRDITESKKIDEEDNTKQIEYL